MKRLLLAFIVVLTTLTAWAVKADRTPTLITQSDGTQVVVIGNGDSHFHWYTTTDGVLLFKEGTDYFVAYIDNNGELTSTGILVHEASKRTDSERALVANQNKTAFYDSFKTENAANGRRKIEPLGTSANGVAYFPHTGSPKAIVILAEFQSLMQRTREDGGVDTARAILSKAFGAERAESMLSKAVPFKGGKPFDYLAEADSDRVMQLLKDEGGAVRALVLSYLNPKVSASVIQELPADEKKDVIMRLARLKELNPEVGRRVDEAMKEKMDSLATEKSDRIDGRSALAQILKKMPMGAEEEILGNLSAQDPDLGADLRSRLFTEEDILNADDRFIAETLHSMDNVSVAFLIAGKSDDFRRKVLTNVSQNRAGMILDEEAARRPLRRSDCEQITSLFFATLRRAWEDGSLIIKGRDDEIYV